MTCSDRLDEVRCAALVLVDHEWPVVRGTYFDGDEWRGRPGSAGLRPVDDDWTASWTTDPGQVDRWWATEPYSPLLVCGEAVDCLQVPAGYGARMLAALAAANLYPPAMRTPTGQLTLFVRTDHRSYTALVSATLCTLGSWVGLPPTAQRGGLGIAGYHWVPGLSPDRLDWRLPDLPPVYEVIAATATTTPSPHRP